jgi:succinyl-diaminopimelate desuccinylase
VADENYLATRTNIPTITLGPKGGNAHSANEYVEIDSVVKASKIIAYACYGFLTDYGSK